MSCDQVYWERNRLVAALSRFTPLFGDHIHIVPDPNEEGWYIIYIEGPTGQMSWHMFEKDRRDIFPEVEDEDSWPWDGHTTEEKYARLSRMGL